MRSILFAGLALSMVAIILFLTFLLQSNTTTTGRVADSGGSLLFSYSTIRYPARVELVASTENPKLGMNIDYWQLDFGIMPVGGSGGRKELVLQNAGQQTKVRMHSYGNISDMISFPENNFILDSLENRTVDVVFSSGENGVGAYNGEVVLTLIKPRYDLVYGLLWLA